MKPSIKLILIPILFFISCGKTEHVTYLNAYPQSTCSWQVDVNDNPVASGYGDTIIVTEGTPSCVSVTKTSHEGKIILQMYDWHGAGVNNVIGAEEEFVAQDTTSADSGSVATVCSPGIRDMIVK